MKPWSLAIALLILAAAHALTGCSAKRAPLSPGREGVVADESFRLFRGEYKLSQFFEQRVPSSIAVLPFYGDPKDWGFVPAGISPPEIVRRGLYNHLSSLPFRDLELNETDARLGPDALKKPAGLLDRIRSDPAELKELLGVDAVVLGRVTHFDRVFLGIFSQVAVGCEVEMYDLASGSSLWRVKHVSRGSAGGVSVSPIGLALVGLMAAWNMRQSELYSQTDDLFREIVSTLERNLPKSFLKSRPKPPDLDLFVCLNAKSDFKAGESISFRLVGEKESQAKVRLSGVKSVISLWPVPPSMKQVFYDESVRRLEQSLKKTGRAGGGGLLNAVRNRLEEVEIYEGSYLVKPGDKGENILAEAVLEKIGARSKAVLADKPLSIDTARPSPPSALVVRPLDHGLELSWKGSSDTNLAGYEILAGPAEPGPYKLLSRTGRTRAVIRDLENFTPLAVKVAAVDRAGNLSDPAGPVVKTPTPEPGLEGGEISRPYLSGRIRGKVLLTRRMSPYMIRADLVVPPGSSLVVEPGATLRFAPGSGLLVLGGTLAAYGEPDRPVRMSASGPGGFKGVVLDRAERTVLKQVEITGAETGLRIRGCSPEIAGLFISGSSQAGLHLQDRSGPVITGAVIENNSGMGGIFAEGPGLSPRIGMSVIRNNTPFQVQNLSPIALDLRGNYWGRSNPAPEEILGRALTDPVLAAPPENLATRGP